MIRAILFTTAILLFASISANGFTVAPMSSRLSPRLVDTRLGLFGDALKKAFTNDDTLGERKNEGLKGGPNYNDNVTVNGKAVQGAVVGQKLTVVAGRARVKIPVNCQKGDCGTCMVKMNGKKVKACQTSLGSGKCSIETL
jgi:ferredoxin